MQVKCFAWLAALTTRTFWAALLCLSCALYAAACERLLGASTDDDSAFARCAVIDAPRARELSVGATKLRVHDRELTIEGLAYPWTLAAFSGPAPGSPLQADALQSVRTSNPALVLVLGGLGETEADVSATLGALAALPVPVLLVQGGRDRPSFVHAALEKGHMEHVIDLSALHRVRVGRDSFIVLPGASRGAYAVDENACGHVLDDVKALSQELGALPAGERRFLWAWHAPASLGAFGVARDERGVEAGDPDLGELAARIGAPGGLFAWPHVRAGQGSVDRGRARMAQGQASGDLALVVPRLGGVPLERSDGGQLASSAALVTFDASGARLDALLTAP